MHSQIQKYLILSLQKTIGRFLNWILLRLFSLATASSVRSRFRNFRGLDVIAFCRDNDRGYSFNGLAYSPLIDTVIDSLSQKGLRCLRLASAECILIGQKAHGSPVSLKTITWTTNRTWKLIRIVTLREADPSKYTRVVWQNLLTFLRPKAIIAIEPDSELCSVCHELNLFISELQHGVIGDAHPRYGPSFCKPLKSVMLPNRYLCWDERSYEVLSGWAKEKEIEVRIIGHPWLNRFYAKQAGDRLVEEHSRSLSNLHKPDRTTVLVSLQWGCDMEYANTDLRQTHGLPHALIDIIKQQPSNYCWLLRLHPVQVRSCPEAIRFLSQEFGELEYVEWDLATTLPLPVVLEIADMHVTLNSTVVQEATWYGVPTALLCPHLKQGEKYSSYFTFERNSGYAELVDCNQSAVVAWLNRMSSAKKGIQTSFLDKSLGRYRDFIRDFPSIR